MATCTGKTGCKGKIILNGMCCRHVKQQCSICFDNKTEIITKPCKHYIMCKECSKKVTHCPYCRTKISQFIFIKIKFNTKDNIYKKIINKKIYNY